jgi:hypothetical protein
MTTATAPHHTRRAAAPAVEQLSLLPESHLPVQFRLDRRTRERGLAHIAEIRARLAERTTAPAEPAIPSRAA